MKPITYLCFTLLSIAIQFCLVDFINGGGQSNNTITNGSSKNVAGNLTYILKHIKEEPHALFYRTATQKDQVKSMEQQKYNNLSLTITSMVTTTEYSSTLFDLLFEENSSTVDDYTITTETYYTSSDLDNVTEINLFDKKSTTTKPTETPKTRKNKKCHCDLMYKYCDINCCCDSDCSETESTVFNGCIQPKLRCLGEQTPLCQQTSLPICNSEAISNIVHYLFCIDKINLPSKIKQNPNKLHPIDTNKVFKWRDYDKGELMYKFNKTIYKSGESVWFLENGIFDIMKIPTMFTNKYCNGQKEMKFLHNEYIKCYVKINELHMLHLLRLTTKSTIVSATTKSNNSTILNCTTLHCTNWTLQVCDGNACIKYNETLHVPTCSDSYCYNIATKVEYMFYCNNSIITEAIIKLHVKQVSAANKLVSQEIYVNFYMGNDSKSEVIKYSGNPGYLKGYPLIVSFVENNHTKHFYNGTNTKRHLLFPCNDKGICLFTNITHNVYKFGQNEQMKCRLRLSQSYITHNKTDGCIKIQERIIEYVELNKLIFISPIGNPRDLRDDEWLTLKKFNKSNVYGQYYSKTKFVCHNIIIRFAFIIVFADVSEDDTEQYKILSATVEGVSTNVSFSIQSLSAVVTVDTRFIDATQHGPRHLANNLFLPLKSTSCNCVLAKLLYLYLVLSTIVF